MADSSSEIQARKKDAIFLGLTGNSPRIGQLEHTVKELEPAQTLHMRGHSLGVAEPVLFG